MASKAQPPKDDILEIHGVPTAAGLAKEGRHLAYKAGDGAYRITDAGYERLREAMTKNADEAIARGDGDWTAPPSTINIPAAPNGDL